MEKNHRPIGQVDAVTVPRYAGLATFAKLPTLEEVDKANIAILGVPFDSGVIYRPGARFGPNHVREASRMLSPYNPALDVEPFGVKQVVDAGDVIANPFSIKTAVAEIEAHATKLGNQVDHLITIGGDHTIALPLLRAINKKHGPVAVLHFDAHLDTWETYFGAAENHGTPFRRASEEGLIDQTASIHIGIRSPLYGKGDLEDDAVLGFQAVTATFTEEQGVEATIQKMLKRLGDKPIYISVDIDVLDPAHAPGTGTPEVGGLTSRELLRMLRALRGLNIVGADVVEVSPPYDHAQITGFAASQVVFELVSVLV